MTRRTRIEHSRLAKMEDEFNALLLACLRACSKGRWGLFGQNARVDPEDRYWPWPEAKQLRHLASEMQAMRSEAGERNPLCDKFLVLCELTNENAPGEPKLAAKLLAEIEDQ